MDMFEFRGSGGRPPAGVGHFEWEAAGRDDRHGLPEIFFPEIADWRPALDRLGIADFQAMEIAAAGREDGRSFWAALRASGLVPPDELLAAVAAELDIGFVLTIDPARLIVDDEDGLMLLRHRAGHVPVKLMERDGSVTFLITTQGMDLPAMRERLARHPALAARLKLADPETLRAAILRKSSPRLVKRAVNGLADKHPGMSARTVVNGWQGSVVGVLCTVLPFGLLLRPDLVFFTLHLLATLFFFACVALRFAAVASVRPRQKPTAILAPGGDAPVFSVLVALYREADVIPDLVASLDRLVWPRDRLEIKLVCEADDAPTLAAIRAVALPSYMEVIEVPQVGPRTKPKALAYALSLTGGDLVALYDAEDQPHPMQLAEAWQCFQANGENLAVVQAPLEISNRGDSTITRMFAFEYAGLFRGLLPWLSSRRLMLPLGGTSNHFRRTALDAVGGWDPFNVTEDADLGMRLARFGYRAQTISCPTYEAAPRRFGVWLPQRTRWFKGWAQTWLVHMREPGRLLRELGLVSFLVSQVLFAGMLASVMLHPFLLASCLLVAVNLFYSEPGGTTRSFLLLVDMVNITCGYLSFLLLGWQTLSLRERAGYWKVVLFTPAYWAMMSYAGWRAIWHLRRRPHVWEKTPHEKSRRLWQSLRRPAGPVSNPSGRMVPRR